MTNLRTQKTNITFGALPVAKYTVNIREFGSITKEALTVFQLESRDVPFLEKLSASVKKMNKQPFRRARPKVPAENWKKLIESSFAYAMDYLEHQNSPMYLAVARDRACGLLVNLGGPSIKFLTTWPTREFEKAKGIGSSLVCELFNSKLIKEKKPTYVCVEASLLTKSVGFYEKLGFYFHQKNIDWPSIYGTLDGSMVGKVTEGLNKAHNREPIIAGSINLSDVVVLGRHH